MKLVIAEKPMLARDIASAICKAKGGHLPAAGGGYTVVACSGHLLELAEPDEVRPEWGKPWRIEELPIYIEPWPKKPGTGMGGQSNKPRLEEIKRLAEAAECVIHAGDPDDEGQLIVDEVLEYIGYTGPVWRVYVNDSIEKNIVKAFAALVPNEAAANDGKAANARQIGDFTFGVNESRLAAIRLKSSVSVGRVQTPTLGLVVKRDEAIAAHEERTYYEPYADVSIAGRDGTLRFKYAPASEELAGEKHLFDKELAGLIADAAQENEHTITVAVKKKATAPPLPYNLTVLIEDMSRKHKMSAQKVQDVTQSLRDSYKAITYNRTDSQYLKEEHFEEAAAVLGVAIRNIGVAWPLDFTLKSKAFNDGYVSAHHGIIPQETAVPMDRLTEDERNVYRAVVERYALQFLPPKLQEVSEAFFKAGAGRFAFKSALTIDEGWRAYDKAGEADDDSGMDEAGAQWLDEGIYKGIVAGTEVKEGKTSPPKPYTDGTLVADMASISKYIEDPRIKAILREKDKEKKGECGGIGTTATRPAIIEALKKRGLIEERAGKIAATRKGVEFYHLLPPEIAGADVTALWWLIQQEVAAGRQDVYAIARSVVDVFNSHKATAYEGKSIAGGALIEGAVCPVCGSPIHDYPKVITCTSNKGSRTEDGKWEQASGCGWRLFKKAFGKKLTERQAKELITAGVTKSIVKGLTSKAGKPFEARLGLDEADKSRIVPIFEEKSTRGKATKSS